MKYLIFLLVLKITFAFDSAHSNTRKDGDIRTDNRTLNSTGSPSCGLFEVLSCKSCEKSCKEPHLCKANDYSDECSVKCFCEDSYVRAESGSCVKLEDCVKGNPYPDKALWIRNNLKISNTTSTTPTYDMTCGLHQVYKSCQPCERTCAEPNPHCAGACLTGCFCEDEYYKAPDGRCVRHQDCPKAEMSIGVANEPSIEECQPDEVFVWCGWCEATCSQPAPDCPPDVCTRGCLCRPPLLRHRSGHCVEQKDCLGHKCPDRNEEYVCRYGCEPRCERRTCVRERRCSLGCHCKLGLLRDRDGRCVTIENCSKNITRSN